MPSHFFKSDFIIWSLKKKKAHIVLEGQKQGKGKWHKGSECQATLFPVQKNHHSSLFLVGQGLPPSLPSMQKNRNVPLIRDFALLLIILTRIMVRAL